MKRDSIQLVRSIYRANKAKGSLPIFRTGLTDTFKAYNALDVSRFHHQRINHSQLFADKHNHINGIENFYWFLKECEWRFNGGNHAELLKQLKYWYKQAKH